MITGSLNSVSTYTCPGCGYVFTVPMTIYTSAGTSPAEFVTCPRCGTAFRFSPGTGCDDPREVKP